MAAMNKMRKIILSAAVSVCALYLRAMRPRFERIRRKTYRPADSFPQAAVKIRPQVKVSSGFNAGKTAA